jgi:hypothetical protein
LALERLAKRRKERGRRRVRIEMVRRWKILVGV